MSATNNMILIGRLTKDPQTGATKSGVNWAHFTVAWSKKTKDTEQQLFMNCNAWRQQADFVAKYFHKGDAIAVTGECIQQKRDDMVYINMEVSNVDFVPGAKKSEAPKDVPAGMTVAEDDDVLPF